MDQFRTGAKNKKSKYMILFGISMNHYNSVFDEIKQNSNPQQLGE